jgi:glycosyltransferase involved in cell wall biosynthesis
MRIAIITNSRIPSLTANSIQAMKVCQALAQLGHDVCLFTSREGDTRDWDAIAAHYGLTTQFDIKWLPMDPRLKLYDFTLYSLQAAKAFNVDIVYTWVLNSALVALWSGIPAILEIHGDVVGGIGPWMMRRFWRSTTQKRMLVTTSPLRDAVEDVARLKFPEGTVQIAPNGIDPAQYENLPSPAGARKELGFEEKLTVGFTGHIYPGRGADMLFELAQRIPEVNFLWVGGKPEMVAHWQDQVQAAGVTNVNMTGFVANSVLPLYQSAADILLMPYGRSISASSGQDIAQVINPMKMFDYMAAGRAIVSADLPVIHEVLNEQNAVFAEPSDVDAWERTLRDLLADEPRRLALAAQARKDVATRTWLARAEQALKKFPS